jgi:hypothetical protein
LVQNQRNKYDNKIKEEMQRGVSIDSTGDKMNMLSTKTSTIATSDRKKSLNSHDMMSSMFQHKKMTTLNNEAYEEKQRQMRIKYGSSRAKQNVGLGSTHLSSNNIRGDINKQQIIRSSQ